MVWVEIKKLNMKTATLDIETLKYNTALGKKNFEQEEKEKEAKARKSLNLEIEKRSEQILEEIISGIKTESKNELGLNIFAIENFIECLYKYSINNAANVFDVCHAIDVAKIIRGSMNSAVLHFSHYLPNGKEFFSDPHFKKGYGAFLLAESGDNMEVFMNGQWELIGLNEGQILAIPGKKLDECTHHEIPALKHRIKSSENGYFAMKLFPTD